MKNFHVTEQCPYKQLDERKPSKLGVCYAFSGMSVADDRSFPAAATLGLHKRRDLQWRQDHIFLKFQLQH